MKRVVFLCFLVVAELASLSVPAHAQQGGAQRFAVEPAPGSSVAATGDYFLLRTTRGGRVTQALVVRNDSMRPIDIRLAAVDATTGPYGGVSYGLPGETAARLGKWISLERRSLRLAPRASTRVEFTVAIAAGVTSGEHLGGLAIWSPATDEKEQAERGEGQAGASIEVQTRRIIAVLVRLPGAAEPKLAITGVTPAARPDGAYLEVGIENRGSGLTKAKGVISLPDETFRERFEVDTFVPGTSIAYPVRWAETPREGEHRARVELEYASRKTSWEGTFTVGDEVAEELFDRGAPGSGPAEAVEASGRSDGVLLAAGAAAAAALVSVLAGAMWLVSRRRRRRVARGRMSRSLRNGSSGDPAPSGVPLPLPTAADESSGRDDGGRTSIRPAASAKAGVDAAPRAPARTEGSAAPRDDAENDPARAAAAVGAAAFVGGALWLLMRARSRGRP